MTERPEFKPRTATYQADPDDVHRVCLLYSGGLDTSVMLKWIQEQYGAEIVALTINLGQPGEDFGVVEGKARDLGAIDARVVDAREEFAQEGVRLRQHGAVACPLQNDKLLLWCADGIEIALCQIGRRDLIVGAVQDKKRQREIRAQRARVVRCVRVECCGRYRCCTG